MLVEVPRSKRDTPSVGADVEEDTGGDAIAEFEESVTAVTEERKLSEALRRELEFKESVRKHLAGRANHDDSDDGDDDDDDDD